MINEQRGLWISMKVLYSAELTPTDKLILADILALSKDTNQFVKTNNSIEAFTNVSNKTVRNSIQKLISLGLIKSIMFNPYGNVKTKRILVPLWDKIEDL